MLKGQAFIRETAQLFNCSQRSFDVEIVDGFLGAKVTAAEFARSIKKPFTPC